MLNKLTFKDGLKDGIAPGIGYLAVCFGFGVMARSMGFSVFEATVMAGTTLASAGQVAGITIIAAGGTILEIILTMLVINIRYSLMALALTQKTDESFTTAKRALCAFFITDESYAIASLKPRINVKYFLGLVCFPYFGWTSGAFLGSFASSVLPQSISTAMGITIYGMFIAIFVPPMRQHLGAFIAVVTASAIACAIKFIPWLSFISDGFSIIIAAIAGAAAAALIRPIFVDAPDDDTASDSPDSDQTKLQMPTHPTDTNTDSEDTEQ